ncbi:hypothetical protein VXQ18_12380 [Brucella abortus]|nr:hypothetical protein [Brucella abortus]
MPIKIPDDLPATSVLEAEGVMVMREADADTSGYSSRRGLAFSI